MNIDQDQLHRTVRFILELDKLKGVTRKVKPLMLDRYENSAEHSWQIAMMAMSLSSYCDADMDISKVIAMLLVHDIGEIDTGDTMAFVEGGWEERKAQELAAVKRIFGLLPKEVGEEFVGYWEEFEFGESKESLFANALDRAMPVLLNLENNGQSWKENNISYERVIKRIESQINDGFPLLWEYLEARLDDAREKGFFGKDD